MSKGSVNWTREQRQVIESRGNHLLVAAAAGSGKTAVLVERIIRMVTEGDHPLDIDRLLVMTFTNAAAAEMRERIGAAIEQRLDEEPENEHLQAQAALVHYARITTIDSFCLDLIRNYFNLLDLDPAFRIGDEGELTLLRGDVMAELLEDFYRDGGPAFERFVETFAQGKSDHGIEDRILQVYTFSQSNPYPEQWIARCRAELGGGEGPAGTPGLPAEDSPWMLFLKEDLKKQAGELRRQLEDALAVCREDEVLTVYEPVLRQDALMLAAVEKAADFAELYEKLSGISWERLAAARGKSVDPEKKAYVTGCRDRVKKAVAKMKDLYCFAAPEEMAADLAASGEPVGMLLTLAEEFSRRYTEKKRERNLVDFNDLEHEALKVLIRLEDGKEVYTEAADQLSRQFEEVLVDEYQDSNLVQEALLRAVSQERFGRPNVFMVGDVKQSIYKFRLARPELFLEKYHRYEPVGTAAAGWKIELHQNFRSRGEVLAGINDVFYRIMTENLGNIRYTEETALHPGAVFAPLDGTSPEEPGLLYRPELLVMDTGTEALAGLEEDAADYTAKELEARLIARRIRRLTDPREGLPVWDKKLPGGGGYRTASFRDIVILLRSTAGWTETLLAVLMNEGIPAYAESRMGYFNTVEVETVLSLLAVTDNPMQDIPLTAVLRSPVAGMTDEELARLMAWYKNRTEKGQDRGIYGAARLLLAEDSPEEPQDSPEAGKLSGEIRDKLRRFFHILKELREESTYLPIHELIYHAYEKTGYYDYVSAMPAGETRRANLDMLVEKAAAYEETSYKGLFHFIRYIENLKRYNTDFGEASTVGEEDDTVRIMSIHKSKGLEFPIVILAGMGKRFNRQDVYGRILIDPELGIAADCLDLERRLKAPTIKKNVLRRKMELDSLGEELRVLYVAMTRAKEKLIMTGTDRSLAKNRERLAQIPLADGQIPYTILSTANSYLDWLLMSLGCGVSRIDLQEEEAGGLVGAEVERQAASRQAKDLLLNLDPEADYQRSYREQLLGRLDYRYPYEADIGLYAEMSVSELKKRGQLLDTPEALVYPTPEERAEDLPPDGGQGALRGTAYHRALELLPFDRMDSREAVEACLRDFLERNMFPQDYYDRIDGDVIWTFLQSPLGQRMSQAQREGRLRKERQFVIGIPAREMKVADSEELVIIQGIIDAYMEEEDGLVLVDYKTDKLKSPRLLADHYRTQLEYYQRALEQMTKKKVKEKILYSLTMQRAIPV